VPTPGHNKLSGVYNRREEDFSGLSLRQRLRDKSFDEQHQKGIEMLLDVLPTSLAGR